MKTIITAPYSDSGGVSAFVDNIFPCFKTKVHLFYRGNNPKVKSKILSFIYTALMPFKLILYLITKRRSNIIVNTSLSHECLLRDGIIVFLSKLFGQKVLLIIHGFQEKALRHRNLLKYGYFMSDAIAVLSSEFVDLIKKSGYKKPVYLQFNPVSKEIISAVSNSRGQQNSKMQNFLFLSRVIKEKGIFTTLEAFKMAQVKHPEIKLRVGGKGNAYNSVIEMASNNEINNVEFLGFVKGKSKEDLLKDSDIMLFPTEHKEGLPINVLEAMTAGQIIITRPVGGLKDLYAKHNFGYAIESTDPKDFLNAVVDVLSNKEKYQQIAKNNAEFAKKHFHPQKIANDIEKILETL